jgi:hypothetical protein
LNVELLYNLLRLQLLALLRWGVGEWEVLLVGLDLVEPFRSVDRLELGNELGQGCDNITENGDLGLDDLVDVLGLDFEMNDTTSSLKGSGLGSRCKG